MDDIALLRILDSCHKDEVEEIHGIIQEGLESTKSRWLVNTLVDYYFHSRSLEALSIIKKLPGVQADAIFDKLNDSLLQKETCLPCLKLLLYMATAQLSWLYQIVKTSLFTNLLKLLKTCKNVMILTFGIYCVTSTLALSPVAVTVHLPDMFEIFSRLIVWKEVEGGILPPSARVLYLHLDVGIYHYFLQLYAMFPCTFLQYLKARYGPKGEASIFNKNIEPLFAFAQIHPKLISYNSETERDKKTWAHLEPHDVALMSTDISLDPAMSLREDITTLLQASTNAPEWSAQNYKSQRESSAPADFFVDHESTPCADVGEYPNLGSIKEEVEQHSHGLGQTHRPAFYEGPLADSHTPTASEDFKSVSETSLTAERKISSASEVEESLRDRHVNNISSRELKSLWSPSEVLGMVDVAESVDGRMSNRSSVVSVHSSNTGSGVTSSQISTVSSPALDVSGRGHYPWHHSLHQQSMTKATYSPTASTHSAYIEDEMSGLDQRNYKTNQSVRYPGGVSKEVSSERLAQSLPSSRAHSEGSGPNSTFSSPTQSYRNMNSPKTVKKDPGMLSSAWNKLKRAWKGTPEKPDISTSGIDDQSAELFQDFEHISVIDGKAVFSPPVSSVMQDRLQTEGRESTEGGVRTLENSPESLRKRQRVPGSGSRTVSVSSTSDMEDTHSVPGSSESGKPSDSEGDNVLSAEEKLSSSYPFSPGVAIPQRSHNSMSLPSEMEGDAQIDPTQQRLRALLRIRRPSFVVDAPSKAEMSNSCPSSTAGTPRRVGSYGKLVDSPFSLVSRLSSGDISDFAKESKLTKSEGLSESIQSRDLHLNRRTHSTCSTTTLVAQSPVTITHENRESKLLSPPQQPRVKPHTESVSPIVILDDYIKMGTMIHHFETDEMPLPDHDVTDWSHFGTCIHQEELAVAECQVGLLQSQLLFERYKCQQHIQRNRRLRSTASRAVALSEEVTALERTNHLLRESLRAKDLEFAVMKENCRRESDARQQLESRAKKEIQSYYQKTGQLREDNSRLKEDLKTLNNRNQQLLKKLEESEAKVFYMDNRHAYLQQQILLAKDMEGQIALLKKERLVLGEWEQQQVDWNNLAKHRLSIDGRSTATPTDRTTADEEMSKLRSEVELLKAQLSEVRNELVAKDNVIANCRKRLEEELLKHKKEVKDLKDKLLSESRSLSAANSKLLEVAIRQPVDTHDREKGKTPSKASQIKQIGHHRRTASQPSRNLKFGADFDRSSSLTNSSIMEN